MAALSHLSALLLVLFFSVHQSNAVGCEGKQAGDMDCDPTCNFVISCQAPGIWTNITNCQLSSQVCSGPTVTNEYRCESTNEFCTGGSPMLTCNSAIGLFFYPSDCTSYYECEPGQELGIRKKCKGFAFNPCTQDCSEPLINGSCPAPSISACRYDNHYIRIPGTDSYYYRCYSTTSGAAPSLLMCSPESRYNEKNSRCDDVGNISGCTVCAGGWPASRPHGRTTCSYIWCDSANYFSVRHCTPDHYFNATLGSCVRGACS